jgi:hypothetical protein
LIKSKKKGKSGMSENRRIRLSKTQRARNARARAQCYLRISGLLHKAALHAADYAATHKTHAQRNARAHALTLAINAQALSDRLKAVEHPAIPAITKLPELILRQLGEVETMPAYAKTYVILALHTVSTTLEGIDAEHAKIGAQTDNVPTGKTIEYRGEIDDL